MYTTGVVLGVVLGAGVAVLGSVEVGAGLEGAGSDDGCVDGVGWVGWDGVCDGDVVGDQGGFGAAGVEEDGCVDGNQLVAGPDGLSPERDGLDGCRVVGSRGGTPGRRLGEAPAGLPAEGVSSDAGVSVDVGGWVVTASRALNGAKNSRPASASTTAASAPSLSGRGPAYRPTSLRTGFPCLKMCEPSTPRPTGSLPT
ncbi:MULTISPECIES: hypothetical protein [unclassified Kribbella]|uniref:hypothetical protein n=1 Tax=unclassified Kribbella TaxID=2644121 RepID=UPI0030185FD7